jgi:hypothetical protein
LAADVAAARAGGPITNLHPDPGRAVVKHVVATIAVNVHRVGRGLAAMYVVRHHRT